jgi:hypothetical protein
MPVLAKGLGGVQLNSGTGRGIRRMRGHVMKLPARSYKTRSSLINREAEYGREVAILARQGGRRMMDWPLTSTG